MNEKQNLRTAFEQRRKPLEDRLQQISDPRELVRCIETELSTLQQSCVGSLPVQEAKLLMHCLDVLRVALRGLSAVSGRPVEAPSAPASPVAKAPLAQIVLTLGQLGLLVALATAPLGIPLLARSLIVLVVVLLVVEFGFQVIGHTASLRGGNVGRLLAAFGLSLPKPALPPSPPPPAPALISVDGPKLCDKIASALAEIDNIVATTVEAASRTEPEPNPFARERPLLEFLQELLAASLTDDSATALKKAKSVPGLLLRHGLKAVSHEDIAIGKRAEMFDTFPNIDPAATRLVTERPALLDGERVELRGRLLEPTRSTEPSR